MTDATTPFDDEDRILRSSLRELQDILARQKRVENLVHRKDMPRHELVEYLVHKQPMNELKTRLAVSTLPRMGRILEVLPQDDGLLVWELICTDHGEEVLAEMSDAVRETLLGTQIYQRRPLMLNAFELHNGRLRQIPVETRED